MAKTLSSDVRTGLLLGEQVRVEESQVRERRQEDGDALAALLLKTYDRLKGFPVTTNGSSSE